MTSYIIAKTGDVIKVPEGNYRKWNEDYVTVKDASGGSTLAVVPREAVTAVMMTDNFEVISSNAN